MWGKKTLRKPLPQEKTTEIGTHVRYLGCRLGRFGKRIHKVTTLHLTRMRQRKMDETKVNEDRVRTKIRKGFISFNDQDTGG